jgi:hypothetical protein
LEDIFVTTYIEDKNNIDDKLMKEDMISFALYIMDKLDEKVPDNSMSVGNIYDSKKYKNCQIRFIENNIIMRIIYHKDSGNFKYEVYKLQEIYNGQRIKENPNDEIYYLGMTKGEN